MLFLLKWVDIVRGIINQERAKKNHSQDDFKKSLLIKAVKT